MRKIFTITFVAMLCISLLLVGCTTTPSEDSNQSSQPNAEQTAIPEAIASTAEIDIALEELDMIDG